MKKSSMPILPSSRATAISSRRSPKVCVKKYSSGYLEFEAAAGMSAANRKTASAAKSGAGPCVRPDGRALSETSGTIWLISFTETRCP